MFLLPFFCLVRPVDCPLGVTLGDAPELCCPKDCAAGIGVLMHTLLLELKG